jgi:hypothetical protein
MEQRRRQKSSLARIQKAIPGAQAIITHPRSSEKISVLISNAARRDQILQSGIQGLKGAKVIRRPRLVMISGISIQQKTLNLQLLSKEKRRVSPVYESSRHVARPRLQLA